MTSDDDLQSINFYQTSSCRAKTNTENEMRV